MSARKPTKPPDPSRDPRIPSYRDIRISPTPSTSGVQQPGSGYPLAAESDHDQRGKPQRRPISSPEQPEPKKADFGRSPPPEYAHAYAESEYETDSDDEPSPTSTHSTGYRELPSTQLESPQRQPSFAAVAAAQPPRNPTSQTPPRDPVAASTPAEPQRIPKGYPPLVVDNLPEWPKHFRALHTLLGHPPNARPFGKGVRFIPKDADEYRVVQRYLTEASAADSAITWHCYSVSSDLPTKVAIRGLPASTPIEDIKTALEEKGFGVSHIKHIQGALGRPGCLFFVALEHQRENDLARLYSITELLYMPGITIEGWRGSGGVPQCHRCQAFGHSSLNCHRPPKCVRCAEGHITADCPRPRDAIPTCANCRKSHPACYKNCPVYRKEARKRGLRVPPPLPTVQNTEERQQRPTRADRRRAQQPAASFRSQERPHVEAPPIRVHPQATLAPPTNEPTPRGEPLPQRKARGRRRKGRKPATTEAITHDRPQPVTKPEATGTDAQTQKTHQTQYRHHPNQCENCGHPTKANTLQRTEEATGVLFPVASRLQQKQRRRARPESEPQDREATHNGDPIMRLFVGISELLTAIINGTDLKEAAMRGLLHINPDY